MMLSLLPVDWRELWANERLPESGSVYTRPEVVRLILDLAGYRPDQSRLLRSRLLEPSCGDGAFIAEIVERLVASEKRSAKGRMDWSQPSWASAVCAVDLSAAAVENCRNLVAQALVGHGCPDGRAREIAQSWTIQTDFLLHDWGRQTFDFVVGNPPYIRLEDMPPRIMREYREYYRTATDRADLYVPFFERGLSLLSSAGALAFICANRFAKNQYGTALRTLIAQQFHVRHYVNLEHTQPFLAKVSAYPAVVVIDRNRGASTFATTAESLDDGSLAAIRTAALDSGERGRFERWYPDGAPWISTCRKSYRNLLRLADNLPTLEASAPGTRVGIGVATGADDIFVLPGKRADIEEDRQLPLLMAQDVSLRAVCWSGHWLLNPFAREDDGSLADLRTHPGCADYLHSHEDRLRRRHCAKERDQMWYRTIDRVWPGLQARPKLVLPDIQSGGVVGFDDGRFYPHHNLYWITSTTWDLRVLQSLLRSDLVTEQIRAHSVAMRGGSLRYQAQSLRKLRVPAWESLSATARKTLVRLAEDFDPERLNSAVRALF